MHYVPAFCAAGAFPPAFITGGFCSRKKPSSPLSLSSLDKWAIGMRRRLGLLACPLLFSPIRICCGYATKMWTGGEAAKYAATISNNNSSPPPPIFSFPLCLVSFPFPSLPLSLWVRVPQQAKERTDQKKYWFRIRINILGSRFGSRWEKGGWIALQHAARLFFEEAHSLYMEIRTTRFDKSN